MSKDDYNLIAFTESPNIGDCFLEKPGVYYCPVGDEFFVLEFLGEAPCNTGELIPNVRITFCDDVKQGAIPDTGQIYCGKLKWPLED